MKIACSGSNGFIGRHLIKRLKALDYEVLVIPREFLYIQKHLETFFKSEKPDYIFHLAGYSNHFFQDDEELAYKANIEALHNLIEATKDISYKGFLNFSTTFHNLEAGSFYGSTKAAGEYLVRAYVRKYDLPIVNIRPYSIFGEYEWNFRFIPTISDRISKGKPITVSDVSHDWTYVEDFIDGLLHVKEDITSLKGLSIGIGTGIRRSNFEIANILLQAVNKNVPIVEGVKRSYEIAAYNKEIQNKTNEQKNEIFFNVLKTPIEDALKRVYNSPNLWLKR